MPCESCNVQFGLITRKKSCYECRRLFCRSCIGKQQDRLLCTNCRIFTKRPLTKVDLAPLKVKDLIFYLQSKHISTSGCVEKEDLINLIIAHVNSSGSSPRTPGSRRGYNFSPTGSTGGGNSSGGSSRHGSFYATSAENCSNTFDQIKNTCQSLFSTITEKLGTDLSKTTQYNSRFSPTASADNVQSQQQQQHQQTQQQHSSENINTQPRFGNNNVYSIDIDTTNPGGQHSVAGLRPTSPTANTTTNTRASELHYASSSSGNTSGADSSGHASSVSSPAHEPAKAEHLLPEHYDRSINRRIETILAMEANANGCNCSEEEEEEDEEEEDEEVAEKGDGVEGRVEEPGRSKEDEDEEMPRRKQSRKSLSQVNLLQPLAGPSETTANVERLPVPGQTSDTSSSSFDELLPECGPPVSVAPTVEPAASTNSEQWQLINTSDASGTNGTSSEPVAIRRNVVDGEGEPSGSSAPKEHTTTVTSLLARPLTARRRSDSCLMSSSGREGTLPQAALERHPTMDGVPCTSQPSIATGKCFRCGKRRSGIRRQLRKFRQQLAIAVSTEDDKRKQLEAFLNYLERRIRGSFELSDSDSITEEGSVSLAESDGRRTVHEHGGVAGSMTPLSETIALHSDYPCLSSDQQENNIYSAGNQELASMRHIKISDIRESADLDVLSVKQLKEILMLNRVDFKGCCEKAELRERVLRLWRDYKSIPSIEKLPSDDLCKICMDAPIECVILECGHMTTCTSCGKVLSECPICRQYIVRVVRFFRA